MNDEDREKFFREEEKMTNLMVFAYFLFVVVFVAGLAFFISMIFNI